MGKLYVDAPDKSSLHSAHLCIAEDQETFELIMNFFLTRFGEDHTGVTFEPREKYLGFVFWWHGEGNSTGACYKVPKECFQDIEFLGVELHHLKKSFGQYPPMLEYIEENSL